MNKNIYKIVTMVLLSIAFQACGPTAQEGFTESDINVSQPALTPGIQEGLCEETLDEFIFKSKTNNTVRFVRGTGIVVGPDGEEYVWETTKSSSSVILEEPYPCTMEVFENGDIEFVGLGKSAGDRRALVRGVAMVN